jgi:hypothetical protein
MHNYARYEFRGAQAASLPRPAACRANASKREIKSLIGCRCTSRQVFVASCHELQAGSLRSPSEISRYL